ncbi:hypothetical protein Trydic_g18652 [Trypoxylus dichotomus]
MFKRAAIAAVAHRQITVLQEEHLSNCICVLTALETVRVTREEESRITDDARGSLELAGSFLKALSNNFRSALFDYAGNVNAKKSNTKKSNTNSIKYK